jgi:transmembrane protein
MTPKWVARILESEALWLLARLLLTFMYWYAGIGFLIDFNGAQAVMAANGVQPAALIAALTIVCELFGSALIILDRFTWFGAGVLGVFTLMTIPLVHHFWTMTGLDAVQAMLESEEHITVIGGLIGISILSQLRRQWKAARA